MAKYDKKDISVVKVNGYTLPVCSSYSGSLSDLDLDSGRSVNDGVMIRKRLRKAMYKLEFSYDFLTSEEATPILNAIEPVFFDVEFFAVDKNKRITKRMYVGDRSYEWKMVIPPNKREYELCVTNLKFNFIEK